MKRQYSLPCALLLCALALCSCRKQDTSVPSASAEGGRIVFSASESGWTKAFAPTTLASLQSSGFKVAGVRESNSEVLFNAATSFDSGLYEVEGGPFYYPSSDALDFYAVYPAGTDITVDSGGEASFTAAHDPDADIVAAKLLGVTDTDGAVTLSFDHVLSQLDIRLKAPDDGYACTLTSLLVSVPGSGTYSFESGAWSLGADEQIDWTGGVAQSIGTQAAGAGESEVISVIPGLVTIEAQWSCSKAGKSPVEYSRCIETSLLQGQKTTLTLTLPNDLSHTADIKLTAAVSEWSECASERSIDAHLEDRLSGLFTVNDNGDKVRFSRGNLRALVNADGSAVTEWSFHEHQYDYEGNTDANRTRKDGYVDLFAWVEKGRYSDKLIEFGVSSSLLSSTNQYVIISLGYHQADCCDWGSRLGGGGWRVLTSTEIAYLQNNSKVDSEATINGVLCTILKPDGWSGTVAESYTAEEWEDAEAAGLVALPLAGTYNKYGTYASRGRFWASNLYYSGTDNDPKGWDISNDIGRAAVRLVFPVE